MLGLKVELICRPLFEHFTVPPVRVCNSTKNKQFSTQTVFRSWSNDKYLCKKLSSLVLQFLLTCFLFTNRNYKVQKEVSRLSFFLFFFWDVLCLFFFPFCFCKQHIFNHSSSDSDLVKFGKIDL